MFHPRGGGGGGGGGGGVGLESNGFTLPCPPICIVRVRG